MSNEQKLEGILSGEIFAVGQVGFESAKPVLARGKGVDSIVQVITTESGNPDRDNKPIAPGAAALSLGEFCVAEGDNSAAVNYNNYVPGDRAFAANQGNIVPGEAAAAFNSSNEANADNTFVAGQYNIVNALYAALFGFQNQTDANGRNSLGSGTKNVIDALNGLIYGNNNVLKGNNGLVGGNNSTVTARDSIGHGEKVSVESGCAAGFGCELQILAPYGFSAGFKNIVKAGAAAANTIGMGLVAKKTGQTVRGKFNKECDALFLVGNGTADDARSNALEIYDGKLVLGEKTFTKGDIGRLTECPSVYARTLAELQNLIVEEIKSGGLYEHPKTFLLNQNGSLSRHYHAILELRAIPTSPSAPDPMRRYVVADIYSGSSSYKMYADYFSDDDLTVYPPTFYGPYEMATQDYVREYIASLDLKDGQDGVGIVSIKIEEE